MKTPVEKQKPSGIVDYVALALTTFGVGYIPGAPGTYGSAVGVVIYVLVTTLERSLATTYFSKIHPNFSIWSDDSMVHVNAVIWSINVVMLAGFCLIGIWASNRSIPFLGNEDPSEAVVDEVMGQLITFAIVPYMIISWPFGTVTAIVAGFLLFRLFDIWKPYPVRTLEVLPGGLGVCADDIVAGFYAGICLAVGCAISIAL